MTTRSRSKVERKVTAATLGSAAVALVTVILEAVGVDVPAAAAVPAATLATFVFGYLVRS